MNNIETLTALVELNPEADTLADMLTDALIEEADQLYTEARKRVEKVRRTALDNRYLTRAACLMSMSAASRTRALQVVSAAVGFPVRFRLVLLIAGEAPPRHYPGGHFDQDAGHTVQDCVTVGAEWLWSHSTAVDQWKAAEYQARWEANTKARR